MAQPQFAEPVKLFVALLWKEAEPRHRAQQILQEHWGPIDLVGPDRLFDVTDYYTPEMGPQLHRRLVSFRDLISPETIREAKLVCNRIEDQFTGPTGRIVNLDIGYLDHNKVVLASAKGAGQKVYLGLGIWSDLMGRYARGKYQPFEWTFPDFKDGRYDDELGKIRAMYLHQLRERNNGRR